MTEKRSAVENGRRSNRRTAGRSVRTVMRNRAAVILVALAVIVSLCAGTAAEVCAASVNLTGLKSSLNSTWLRSGNELLNLRKTAKVGKKGFTQLQGGCSDGSKYAYFAYSRPDDDKVRIVKMRIVRNASDPSKTGYKFVKSSKVLKGIRHGNDMAYVKDPFGKGKDVIIINTDTAGGQHGCYLGFIDPVTLTEKGGGVYRYWEDLSKCSNRVYPKDTKVSKSKRKSLEQLLADHHGFSAITYNADKGLFVATVKTDRDILILKPVWNKDRTLRKVILKRYIRQNKINATSQGIDCDKKYIYTAWSAEADKLDRNIIQVYDWSGRHIGNRTLSYYYEVENLFHTGTGSKAQFYANFHELTVVRKVVKKTVKVKWKKVWKTVNGTRKKVWKYKEKIRRKVVYKPVRDSHCMYLGRIRK